ncbi:MAG: DinB family protein [Ferruginibacter sp.]
MSKPIEGTFPPYFSRYIDKVPEAEITEAFAAQQSLVDHFFRDIPAEKHAYAYAEGKWTLKEMLQHIIDTERIFNFRALCFARKEAQNIPGFEEDDYAANSHANDRSWESLCDELDIVRQSTLRLFNSFNESDLVSSGSANNKPTTVIALGFITVGHVYHHINVARERYL